MTKIYEGFDDEADLLDQFGARPDALQGAEVIKAIYSYGYYEGSAVVLFKKDGKLFEVHGSHCSCYGLEGQWEPEETFKEALQTQDFYLCDEADVKTIKEVINNLD